MKRKATKAASGTGAGPHNSWDGCAETGHSTAPASKQMENVHKNRNTAPPTINATITLGKILAPGHDQSRFKITDGATITGYLIIAKLAGPESCNCDSKNSIDHDIHLELVADKTVTAENKRMICEITPRWRKRLGQYGVVANLEALARRGARVRITGWMFFDPDHENESENTHPGSPKNWRATGWEIHPVTKFEALG